MIIKKLIAAVCCVALTVALASGIAVFGKEKKEYTLSDVPGFDEYTRVALAMLNTVGAKAVAVSNTLMPSSEITATVRITAAEPDGNDHISISTCRVPDRSFDDAFVDGAHTDPVASGKTYTPFNGIDLSDSEGLRVYLASDASGKLAALEGKVRIQFSVSPCRGHSQSELYAEYEDGFVFESADVAIGADGFAYVPFEGAKAVGTLTPADADFIRDYLPRVNAVNIIITPSAPIAAGKYYYLGGLRAYRESAEYAISATLTGYCRGELRISGISAHDGKLALYMDGKPMPPYFAKTVRTDSYGAFRADYDVDTAAVGEGSHLFELYRDGKKVCERTLIFDNTAPYLAYSSVKDGSSQPSSGVINMTAADAESGVASFSAWLDGKEITLPYSYSGLKQGSHSIWYEITDNIGNITKSGISFAVSSDISFGGFSADNGSVTLAVNAPDGSRADIYSVGNALGVTAYSNVAPLSALGEKSPQGEKPLASNVRNLTESKDERYPYQAFEVDVSGVREESVNVSCAAAARTGETLLLTAYDNASDAWRELSRARMNADSVTLSAEVPLAGYAADGKIKLRVSLLSVDNGSDSIAWATDAQHCFQHHYEDGSYRDYVYYIEEQLQWFVSEYNNGNIAYAVNTGDISDEPNNPDMFAEAREVFNILEDANVPNGVVAGNHDANWTNWAPYFGKKYYEGKDWFGGDYGDNKCHYDLVTVGGRDFIILCMGWTMQDDANALKWARNVLNTYPNRTAIIATHGYLGTEGQILYSGAEKFWYIAEDCPNVRMIICGHEPGRSHNIRRTSDGREIVEILHDYQSGTPDYNWWRWGEGGSGLFRYLTFSDGVVDCRTYTASKDDYIRVFGRDPDEVGYFYWDYETENFRLPIELVANSRKVETLSFTAYTGGAQKVASGTVEGGSVTVEAQAGGLWYAVCGGTASAVYPVSAETAAPRITSAFGANGTLTVSWELPEGARADGFTVRADGEIVASVGGSKRECAVRIGALRGEKVTVAVTAESGGVRSAPSECRVVTFGGAGACAAGDADESGETDITDALCALRVSVGLDTRISVSGWFAADMDADGAVTVSDALLILRLAAGL